MKNRIFLYLLLIGITVFPTVYVFAQDTATTTPSVVDLQAIVKQLQEQIKQLQEQITSLRGELEVVKTELAITKTLKRGDIGEEVRKLQELLKSYPEIYPEGLVTGYFGSFTESAVRRFQEKYSQDILSPLGLSGGTGIVGENTRNTLNKLAATPAVPAVPATPAQPLLREGIPAIPAKPAVPAQSVPITGATSTEPTVSPPVTATPIPTPTPTPSPSTATTTPTPESTTTSDTTSPSVPTNLSASAASPSQINLSWTGSTDNVEVVGYKIYRGGTQIVTLAASATSTAGSTIYYSDTALQVSTAYTYTVIAYDAAGNASTQSASASATTQPPPPPDSTPDPTSACLGGNGRVPGLPNCLMPENLTGTSWNEVDNSTGKVLNGAVCSVAVCGRNGEWRTWPSDKLLNGRYFSHGYPENSTYIQTPFDSAYWGQYYTNGVWQTGSGGIVQPGSSQITYPTSSLDSRATNLAAIGYAFESLKVIIEKFLKLLQ